MPSGVYKHKPNQGYKKGHKTNVGRSSWNKGKKWAEHSAKMKGRTPWNKGKKLSDEHKRKLSESHKGMQNSPATQFKKGVAPSNKGKEHLSREKHWNWKGGIENLVRNDERSDSAYGRWQSEVKRRDNRKCRLLNDDCIGQLVAHHILPWKDNKDRRYDVANGITLCKFHHPLKRNKVLEMIPIFQKIIMSS